MDEVTLTNILERIILFAGTLGILIGLDLILGAKITSNLKKVLDSVTFNVDKIIIKISSLFRGTVDKKVLDLDSTITKARSRVILGILLIIVSIAMIWFAVGR